MGRQQKTKLTHPTPVQLPSGAWRCQVMVNGERISVVDRDPEVAHTKALAIKSGLIERKKISPNHDGRGGHRPIY